MAASIVSQKSICIVTGASKGLGKSIALQFSKILPPGSLLILLSRNVDLLNDVLTLIKKRDEIRAIAVSYDQNVGSNNNLETLIPFCLEKAKVVPDEYQQSILINNAGTLEPLEFIRNLDNITDISNFFQINLVGCFTLTAKFLQFFNPSVTKSRIIINISSLAALSPMKSWGLYCMAKAARDMMSKVLASEEDNIRTLNYAPGPLPTDMLITASEQTKDSDLKKWIQDQLDKKTLVDCDDSAKKLMAVLEKNIFENGSHIDYYDEI